MIKAGLVVEGGGMRGVYAAGVLDFFMEKVATEFYNQGVNDAYIRLHEISEDLLSVQKI